MSNRKTNAKNALPTKKQIEDKRDELSEFLSKLLSGEVSLSSEKETIASKLILIKDILEPLRDAVIRKKLTYSVLSKVIDQQIGLKVSAQTLRLYCQNQLGFPKTERDIKPKIKNNNSDKKTTTTDIKKTYNAEDKLSKNNINFD